MGKIKNRLITFIVWFIFLGSFGFAGGGLFLLFAVVPFEEMLVQRGYTQTQIDDVLKYVVFGWIAFGFIVSFLFYLFVWKRKKKWALGITAVTVLAAVSVLLMFIRTDSALIAMSRGDFQQTGERFTFGPYPEEELLIQLKEEGYVGVITLLSPTLPFENQLLQQEIERGEKVGMPIHSFPMLPWVGDNTESINGIKSLVSSEEGKFYIHCYLGKHRVDMVKQVIMSVTDAELEQRTTIFPSDFQRGPVYLFNDAKVIVGPYPTREEWGILIRNRVKEIVSFIDPDSSRGKELKEIAESSDLVLTTVSNQSLEQVASYVQELDEKVYVTDFRSDSTLLDLETILRRSHEPINRSLFSSEEAKFIGSWGVISSSLFDQDTLREAGIKTVITVTSQAISSLEALKEEGVQVLSFSNETLDTSASQYEFLQSIGEESGPVYLYVEGTEELVTSLHRMMQGLYYGIDEEEGQFPSTVSVVEYDLLTGAPLDEKQWEDFVLFNGVKEVIFLYAPSIHSEDLVAQQEELASRYQVSFTMIPMFEDYREQLYEKLQGLKGTKYIIAPEEVKEELMDVLTDY